METYDFGYEFGHRLFHPGGGYADMEPGAIFFGGTEAGRFVATYMVFCESRVPSRDRFRDKTFDRSDVYVITQNALIDQQYMSCVRDQYEFSRPGNTNFLQRWLGRDRIYPREPIHIPNSEDSTRAFQSFVKGLRSDGPIFGFPGPMAINGILAKWIFDWNKDKHAFYITGIP